MEKMRGVCCHRGEIISPCLFLQHDYCIITEAWLTLLNCKKNLKFNFEVWVKHTVRPSIDFKLLCFEKKQKKN